MLDSRKRKLNARTLVKMIDQGLDVEHYIKTGQHRQKQKPLQLLAKQNKSVFGSRLFGSKKTTTKEGKREYQREYMREYRLRKKQEKQRKRRR